MSAEKVPVEGVKGAGIRAFLLFWVEVAGSAVISHLILVGGPCGVGFGGKNPPVGKKNHAENVWNHDPVVCVEIHLGIPAENRLGFIPPEKKVVS